MMNVNILALKYTKHALTIFYLFQSVAVLVEPVLRGVSYSIRYSTSISANMIRKIDTAE